MTPNKEVVHLAALRKVTPLSPEARSMPDMVHSNAMLLRRTSRDVTIGSPTCLDQPQRPANRVPTPWVNA
jgi:hypothetical protein